MPCGFEGISGINYFCQHCPWPHYKQTCCGVPKSKMWLEREICKGMSSPNQCTKLLVQTRDAHSVRLEKKCRSTENLAARGRSPLWWSYSVGFVAGARTIPVYKRHQTISLRLRENISQITMLLILVTLLMCSQYGRFSKEVWMAFSQTCWR